MTAAPRRSRLALLLAPLGLAAAAFITAFTLWPGDPPDSEGAPADAPYVTVFLVDGLSQQVFQEELAAGRLPEIASLMREGTYVKDGITAFPSMTGYGYYPLITGEDAAKSGILGLRWFDRTRAVGNLRTYVGRTFFLMNEDLNPSPGTLFEALQGGHSLTINSYCNRGAHHVRNTGWMFTMAKYKGSWWLADLLTAIPLLNDAVAPDWAQVENRVLDLAIADLPHRPKIQWITFVSPDTYAHVHGMGPRYVELIRTIDTLVGRYRRESRRLGVEPRLYAFLTDHGVEDVKENLDLVPVLGEHGIRARRGTATRLLGHGLDEPIEALDEVDAMVAINGNLMNYIYLRAPGSKGSEGWRARRTRAELAQYRGATSTRAVDLVSLLQGTPGVELTVVRGDDGDVEVHSAGGVASIARRGEGYAYRVSGEDPLRYASQPQARALSDGAPHPARAWLKATHDLEYPFGLVRLHAAMTATGAGDLIVTSLPGFDLARDFELFVGNYRGGHGGLRAEQTRVPYVLAGPGIVEGLTVDTALAEDVGATLFSALGLAPATREGRPVRVSGAPIRR